MITTKEKIKLEIKPHKNITLVEFKIILEEFTRARMLYKNSPTKTTEKAWRAADLKLALAYFYLKYTEK